MGKLKVESRESTSKEETQKGIQKKMKKRQKGTIFTTRERKK